MLVSNQKAILVARCITQAELERLSGNDYMAELLSNCADALCETEDVAP